MARSVTRLFVHARQRVLRGPENGGPQSVGTSRAGSSLFSLFRSEPLKNTGSVARDLLANERTFLAWSRTGLAFVGLGVAIQELKQQLPEFKQQLGLETVEATSEPVIAGALFVLTGGCMVLHGTLRYFSVLEHLGRGYYPPSKGGIAAVAAVSLGVSVAGTLFVLAHDTVAPYLHHVGLRSPPDDEEEVCAQLTDSH